MTYDTGYIRNGEISRTRFDFEVVRRELAIIRDDLHCNAVQIIGGDADRLELAAGYAAEVGLEVWFSPYPLELSPGEILSLFTDCAGRAERLRKRGAEVVFVTGAELSIMNQGFMPGRTVDERLGLLLSDPDRRRERLADVSARVNDFLGKAVAVVRERFLGPITYAAIPVERVDWTPFDIMSVELIRSAERSPASSGKACAASSPGESRSRSPASALPPTAAQATGADALWRSSSTTRVPAPRSG